MSEHTSITEAQFLDHLRSVPAPYMNGIDVVSAGMIQDVEIASSNVSFTLAYKIPSRTLRESFQNKLETGLKSAFPGIANLAINVKTDIPEQVSPQKDAILPGVKNTIAVASGKGGVGKSTVAVNLAVALAQSGARVGLLDADIYGPSIPTMMGITEQPSAYKDNGKTRLLPMDNYGVLVMSIGFLVDNDSALIWRGPMASGAMKQFLTDVDWGQLDYLIFDMPPGTGDIQLTLSQTLPLSGALIVTTPQDISLIDARKGFRMFERVEVPILGIVENMSYYVCSKCGNRDEIFSHGGGREAAAELGVPFLGEIPIQTRIREGGDQGVPIMELDPEGEVAAAFRNAALGLAGKIAANALQAPSAPTIEIDLGT